MDPTEVAQPLILGQLVKAARRGRGLTQVELANAVGSYPRAIIEIERGRSKADLRLILAVLAELDLRLVVGPR